jgi:mycothiol synthase
LAAVDVLVHTELERQQLADLQALLARAGAADGHPALPDPLRAVVAGAHLDRAQLRVFLAYDGPDLVGCAFLSPAGDGSRALHVVVDPTRRDGSAGGDIGAALIDRALEDPQALDAPLRLWAMRATEGDDEVATRHGFRLERDLLQMRVPLPLPEATVAGARPVATRPFAPPEDEQAWLDVNNRAFAGHPEQGAWTLAQLRERLAAQWVDLNGFLMADAPDGSGLIGSCWTKIHAGPPVLGEIYVIAVDPRRHGQGWGKALTVAGLVWLAEQGITVGMLYTDADNTAAVALYRSLGFTVDHVDRAYLHAPAG